MKRKQFPVMLTAKEIKYIRFIARFHMGTSENPTAIAETRKLLWALGNGPNRELDEQIKRKPK